MWSGDEILIFDRLMAKKWKTCFAVLWPNEAKLLLQVGVQWKAFHSPLTTYFCYLKKITFITDFLSKYDFLVIFVIRKYLQKLKRFFKSEKRFGILTKFGTRLLKTDWQNLNNKLDLVIYKVLKILQFSHQHPMNCWRLPEYTTGP